MLAGSLRIVFHVSGHGFGHAARIGALLAALRAREPGLEIHVRSPAPAWLFTERDPAARVCAAAIDLGVLQRNGLDLDLPASLAAHEAFLAGFEGAVAREARALEALRADLVVGDIPPLCFAAAGRAGVPAAAIANFGWDWILEPWAAEEPRWGSPRAMRTGSCSSPSAARAGCAQRPPATTSRATSSPASGRRRRGCAPPGWPCRSPHRSATRI